MDKVNEINKALKYLAEDDDLHDDFKLPQVQQAVKYWMKQVQLDEEEVETLMANRRVIYVYNKVKILERVCKEQGLLSVPIDHMTHRKTELHENIVQDMLGLPRKTAIDVDSTHHKNEERILDVPEEISFTWRAYALFFLIFICVFFLVSIGGYFLEEYANGRKELRAKRLNDELYGL